VVSADLNLCEWPVTPRAPLPPSQGGQGAGPGCPPGGGAAPEAHGGAAAGAQLAGQLWGRAAWWGVWAALSGTLTGLYLYSESAAMHGLKMCPARPACNMRSGLMLFPPQREKEEEERARAKIRAKLGAWRLKLRPWLFTRSRFAFCSVACSST